MVNVIRGRATDRKTSGAASSDGSPPSLMSALPSSTATLLWRARALPLPGVDCADDSAGVMGGVGVVAGAGVIGVTASSSFSASDSSSASDARLRSGVWYDVLARAAPRMPARRRVGGGAFFSSVMVSMRSCPRATVLT